MKRAWWSVAKKEYFGFINSPTAYLIIVPFLLLISFLFLRTALLLGDANLRPFVELLPWFLIVIGPALAMRAFSEENRRRTIELLFAHPISEWAIVAGKFLGLFLFYATMLACTLPLTITLLAFSHADIGLIAAQYLGALFVGSVFLAVGLMTSAYVGNAVGAFLTGTMINFVLILISLNFITLLVPTPIGRVITEVAIQPHVTNISRGVLDLRDILYFVSLVGIFLTASVLKLSERKVAESKAERSKLLVILGLLIAVGIVGNLIMYEYPLQLDATQARRYSLSGGTKKMLQELPDRVVLTLYASENLPAPMQVNLRETSDLLKDYKRFGDKVEVKTVVIKPDPQAMQAAVQKGMREVQFNQIGAQSFAVQTGVLGLEARYGDKTEVIDFIEDAGNLEYELSRRVLKITRKDQPRLGVIDSTTEGMLGTLSQLLGDQYQLVTLSDAASTETWKDLVGVVVFDDGAEANGSTVAAELKNFITNRGNSVFFINGVTVDTQSLSGTVNTSTLTELLSGYGIVIQPNLVFDMQSNEAISLGAGNMRYIVNYPYWIRPQVNQDNAPFLRAASNVVLGWASEMTLSEKEGWKPQPMLLTSKVSGTQEEPFTISPQQLKELPEPGGKALVVGGVAEKDGQRMAAVPDTQVASQDFLDNSAENRVFVSNLIDWVAADPILLLIPRRTAGRTGFNFSSPIQIQVVQWIDVLAPPLIVSVFGLWWLNRRKRLSRRTYIPAQKD